MGPGLHRAPEKVKEFIVDVSVGDNRDSKMCFDKKGEKSLYSGERSELRSEATS